MASKLRIIHLTQFLGIGGLEKVLLILIKEQMSSGHEVVLVVYDYQQAWVEEFRSQGITVDASYKKKEGYDNGLLKYLSKRIKSFDIVHTHDLNPLMYAAPLKYLFKLQGKDFPKLIHTAHGMNHLNARPITRIYEWACAFMTNSTVGVSISVCDYYRNLGVSNKKIVNINNGIQIMDVNNQLKSIIRAKLDLTFNIPIDRMIFVYVARVVPLKDQKILCDLALINPDLTILLVGPSGDAKYWNKINQIRPKNVVMTGERSDINDILISSDFYISSSTHEGIPISVLEAGAIGLPCLLSDIPGHRVLQVGSQDSVACYFKVGNLEDLAKKTAELKSNKVLVQSLASALHKHIKDNFSSKTMYKQYLDIYLS